MSNTPNILYGKTLKQSTKNTTDNWASLSASLWMLGVRHTTFKCVEGEAKCSHKSVGPTKWIKGVLAVVDDSTRMSVHQKTDSQ